MEQNLAPEKTRHSWVNMYYPPYNKELPASCKKQGPFNAFQNDIDILIDTFLRGYNSYIAGEMPLSLEKEFKAFGIPGPTQYEAFHKLFNFFEDEELELLKHKNFCYHNITLENPQSEKGIVEFVEKLSVFEFADQDRKVILSCGSFWGNNLELREKVLGIFESLHRDKGVEIHIYTNCKEKEILEHDKNKKYHEFIKQIKGTSSFGIKERIPIHFIQAGNDYFFLDFPHTEKIIVRLNLFFDLKKIVYKNGFNKNNVEQFFYKLIQQALD